VNAPRFIYVEPRGRQRVVVEKPLSTSHFRDVVVENVGYFESHGHVHVGILDREKTVVVNDPRSEGIAVAL